MIVTETERMSELRRKWFGTWPLDERQELSAENTAAPVSTGRVGSEESGGLRYQRCGGGYRVIRRRRSAD